MICTQCEGNGYVRLCFEAEETIEQCWVCSSSGEVSDTKFFSQSWKEDNGHRAYYHGPLLDPTMFKEYRIQKL